MESYNILLGLYCTCDSCQTIEETSEHTVKELCFVDETFILVEEYKDKKFNWKLYSKLKELKEDEIIDLYAYYNLIKNILKTMPRI
jgi:hypothetical protein